MSHRNKRNKAGQAITTGVNVSADQLEAQARQALSQEQYKVAVQHLKAIVKQGEMSARINVLLQEAYTGRAEQLAAQGMIKEAIVTWEVAISHGLDLADPRYLGWLVQAGQYPRLLAMYRKISAENRQFLQPILAAAALAGVAPLLTVSLPDDDPVRTGYGPARQLLEAWCGGEDDEQLRERMQAIPFRSPYRDLRQIIQSWILLETNPDQVLDSLERIAPASPFQPLAEQVRLARLDALEALPHLSALLPAARACQLEIRGWVESGVTILLKKLETLPDEPPADKLFSMLGQVYSSQLLPHVRGWLRAVIKKAWLLSYAGHSSQRYLQQLEKVTGQLSQEEKLHLAGLTAIVTKIDNWNLSDIWADCHDRFLVSVTDAADATNKNNPIDLADRLLAAAEIGRYLAARWQQHAADMDEDHARVTAIKLLQQSLQHDPEDQVVWARVIEYYLETKMLVDARDTLQEALVHHPDVIALLELGIRIAVAGNAFKKAATYASRILAVDPINTRVRRHLQNAHIAHARKQIKQKKWHLAWKELAEAGQWKSTPLNDTILQVLQAFLAHLDGKNEDRDSVKAIFQRLTNEKGIHPAGVDFIFRHEGILIGLPSRVLPEVADYDDPWKKLGKEGVLALVEIVRQFMSVNPETVLAPLASVSSPLKKAARLKFSASEGERLCEFWLQVGQKQLLVAYATVLQKAWPDKPVFTYYRFVNAEHLSPSAYSDLVCAREKAHKQGGVGISSRIEALLHRHDNPMSGMFDHLFDDHDEDDFDAEFDDEIRADMAKMADLLPRLPFKEVLNLAHSFIERQIVSRILKKHGEAAVRELCQKILRDDRNGVDEYIDQLLSESQPKEVKRKPVQGRLF